MENIDLVNLALVPVVTGVVEAIKAIGLSTKWAPILSIIVGIVGVCAFASWDFSAANIMIGVVTGLAASGLYSGFKTTLK